MTFLWIIGLLILFRGTVTGYTPLSNPTTVEKYPSIVQVEFLSQAGTWSHSCSGSILTSRFILSAAQCFTGWNSAPVFRRIRAGATYRNSAGMVFYVARAVVHPSYRSRSMEGDISVVQLVEQLPSTSNIQRATIASNGTVVPVNLPVVLAGWAQIFAGGPRWNVLREVTVYTIHNSICAQRYRELSIPLIITENMICTGRLDVRSRDTCFDDAGGPIYFRGVVIGVVSGGYTCATATFPGINTSVGSYTDWIIANAVLNI